MTSQVTSPSLIPARTLRIRAREDHTRPILAATIPLQPDRERHPIRNANLQRPRHPVLPLSPKSAIDYIPSTPREISGMDAHNGLRPCPTRDLRSERNVGLVPCAICLLALHRLRQSSCHPPYVSQGKCSARPLGKS
ncbi:hypothetical protein OF83DRAFT_891288 [Amylostereum chailletii]|nr:hypothetical protein OF83DRAFT_891288 [Amylostereum chailletii]